MEQYNNALSKGTVLQGMSCQYQIEDVLGQGSFGITYLASVKIVGALGTIDANQQVAIKEFFMGEINQRTKEGTVEGMTEGSLSYKYKQRFQKEAENISKLNHPNIVKVVDFIEANETSYYVMEYIDGEDLLHYMNDKPLPTDEAIRIIKEVGKALTYMHEEKNMLHLDLKPGNIMRRRSDGHIFLIDFGLTKIYADDGRPETSTTIGLGTPGYAPLEQSNKNSLKPTIDVYALGATLLKLLTAEPIPPAPDVFNDDELLDSIMSKHGVNENVKNAIIQAMEPKPKARLQSVKALLAALSATSSAKEKDVDATIYDSNVASSIKEKSYIDVVTNAKGASVTIDGKWKGTVPNKFEVVQGKHEVIVTNGQEWSTFYNNVVVDKGETIQVYAQLTRKSFVEIKSEPPGSDVFIDGARRGTTPNMLEVTPGKHTVMVANGSDWSSFTESIEIGVGQTLPLFVELSKKERDANKLFSQAEDFYYKKEYSKAVPLYKEAAELCHRDAQNSLGYMYKEGIGVSQNYEESFKWYTAASVNGDIGALNQCGSFYYEGQGVKQDYINAAICFHKAAEAGNMDGMYNLGLCYECGTGVKKNLKEAKKWYEQAASLGHESSIKKLQEEKKETFVGNMADGCLRGIIIWIVGIIAIGGVALYNTGAFDNVFSDISYEYIGTEGGLRHTSSDYSYFKAYDKKTGLYGVVKESYDVHYDRLRGKGEVVLPIKYDSIFVKKEMPNMPHVGKDSDDDADPWECVIVVKGYRNGILCDD